MELTSSPFFTPHAFFIRLSADFDYVPTQKVRRLHSLTADQLNLGQSQRALSARHGQTLFRVSFEHRARLSPAVCLFGCKHLQSFTGKRGQRDRPRIQSANQTVDFMCGLAPVDHRHLLIQHMGVAALCIVLRARRDLI
mgnify:CR=1 FL=1